MFCVGCNVGSVLLLPLHADWSTVPRWPRNARRPLRSCLHVSTIPLLHGLAKGRHCLLSYWFTYSFSKVPECDRLTDRRITLR